MKLKIFFHFVIIILCVLISVVSHKYVKMSDLDSSLSTLQNLSAAIFTLAGIWVAYLYPQAILAFTNSKKISLLKGIENTRRVEELVLVIFVSAFVLLAILVFNLTSGIAKNIPFVISYYEEFKEISIAIILYLSFLQFKSLVSIMSSNIRFINDLHKTKNEQKANQYL